MSNHYLCIGGHADGRFIRYDGKTVSLAREPMFDDNIDFSSMRPDTMTMDIGRPDIYEEMIFSGGGWNVAMYVVKGMDARQVMERFMDRYAHSAGARKRK